MKKWCSFITFAFLCSNLYAEVENSKEFFCKEEFNILEYWHDGMTWEEFLDIRNVLKRPNLIKYVDKISQQQLAKEAGLEIPETYIATREKIPIIDIISNLSTYVAKATHLSAGEGLIIFKDGKNTITNRDITPDKVQECMFVLLGRKARKVESWALHQVEPGFIIQEYIPHRLEVKIQTIWGKAVIGEWRGGERRHKWTRIWGRYDRDGNRVDGDGKAPECWPKAIAAAELMAKGTDALRVDFLLKEGGVLLLNELEIWPESDWSSMKATLEDKLNEGYRKISR